MRTHRKNTVLAAAAIAALSLGLTACGGGDAGNGAASASKAPANTSKSQAPSESAAAAAGGGSGSQAASKPQTGTSGGAGKAPAGSTGTTKVPACTYKDVKITAAKADETPTAHITLTAANTSGSSCRLYEYPLIAFGDIQTAKDVPAVAKSKPQTPVVLKAGESAYANVRIALGGAHEDNKVVTSFNVNLFAADGPAEGSDVVTAPAGGLAVNEAAAKTGYWTYELRNGADEF
ncbi:DUF4232 domain-containing protein [Streptomyces sp. APSN-46.1]|uniref:DUF4232 domain-containing protein n=1 Tax=Streptomyces sp. APSN-46.1 TaxID=2929049 RepID=UPI001FB42ACE|nr:DUF4232 domain-containing protein [Streptomyces sp. APSN-46.1]MCJ1677932.1 DUF4232 domain-containing protein [Streptomyces sp. APSN-46.1]